MKVSFKVFSSETTFFSEPYSGSEKEWVTPGKNIYDNNNNDNDNYNNNDNNKRKQVKLFFVRNPTAADLRRSG